MAYSQYNVSTNGGLYCHANTVTNASANKVADYEGAAALNLTAESAMARGQSFWVQDAVMTRCEASINIGSVFFKPETFGTIWGIAAAAGSTAEATPVTATVYVLDTALVTLPTKQWLIDIDRTSDSKKFQLLAYKGRLTGDFNIIFNQGEYIVHDIAVTCFLNSSNDLLKIIKEKS